MVINFKNKIGLLTKVVTINLLIFSFLFLVLEIAYRAYKSQKLCDLGLKLCIESFKNNFSLITPHSNVKNNIGLFKFHPKLGYAPKRNISLKIKNKPFEDYSVTIDKEGFRKSFENNAEKKVLTIGDSFTFGEEVSDKDTWQSCLNKSQKVFKFFNAGVGGYGTAQALLRGEIIRESRTFDYVLISTLVNHNFIRDQNEFNGGFPKPSVVKKGSVLKYSWPINKEIKGSKFATLSTQKKIPLYFWLLGNSKLIERIYPIYKDVISNTLSLKNKDAAPIKEIIDWTIKKSTNFETKVIWLLQYPSKISSKENFERKLILNTLKIYNIPYIDTYEKLHVMENNNPKNEPIWQGHHTPYGNKLVCKEILNSEVFRK